MIFALSVFCLGTLFGCLIQNYIHQKLLEAAENLISLLEERLSQYEDQSS